MKLKNKLVGLSTLALVGMSQAQAAVDYTPLTSAVSFTDIIAVVLGVAATAVGFILVKNNIGTIISFIKSRAK